MPHSLHNFQNNVSSVVEDSLPFLVIAVMMPLEFLLWGVLATAMEYILC